MFELFLEFLYIFASGIVEIIVVGRLYNIGLSTAAVVWHRMRCKYSDEWCLGKDMVGDDPGLFHDIIPAFVWKD